MIPEVDVVTCITKHGNVTWSNPESIEDREKSWYFFVGMINTTFCNESFIIEASMKAQAVNNTNIPKDTMEKIKEEFPSHRPSPYTKVHNDWTRATFMPVSNTEIIMDKLK